VTIDLRLCHTGLACLEFALRALVDPPVGSRVAHVAIPEDECGVGLDHLEGMFAFAGLGHCVEAGCELAGIFGIW
jgi:hypothetical protein